MFIKLEETIQRNDVQGFPDSFLLIEQFLDIKKA